MRYGSWWRVERVQKGCFNTPSLHIDTRRRYTGRTHTPYGPYVDIHLGFWVIGIGFNPVYAADYDLMQVYANTQLKAEDH